jgi:hypothetical protein
MFEEIGQYMSQDRFKELLELARSGHAIAAIQQAIIETATAVKTGEPVETPAYI